MMISVISTEDTDLSDSTKRYINKHLLKLERFLPNLPGDLPLIDIVIKGHRTREYFDGRIVLRLPFKVLAVNFEGEHIDQAIEDGFDDLFKELDKYKSELNPDDSEYPDRGTIRG